MTAFKRTNFAALTVRSAITECREFEQPGQDEKFVLQVRVTGSVDESYRIQEKAREYTETFVEGKDGMAPAPVPIRDELLKPSQLLCQTIAMMDAVQLPPTGEAPYNFHEFAQASEFAPLAFMAATSWILKLRGEALLAGKNDSRAKTESSSAPPSSTEQPTTQP